MNDVNDDPDYPVLGPECFTDREGTVISYKGDNYYKACGVVVAQLEGGGYSSCVAPGSFEHSVHFDSEGRKLGIDESLPEDTLLMPWPRLFGTGTKVSKTDVRTVYDLFAAPLQDRDRGPQSLETQCLLAILRAVYNATPGEESVDNG